MQTKVERQHDKEPPETGPYIFPSLAQSPCSIVFSESGLRLAKAAAVLKSEQYVQQINLYPQLFLPLVLRMTGDPPRPLVYVLRTPVFGPKPPFLLSWSVLPTLFHSKFKVCSVFWFFISHNMKKTMNICTRF